MYIIRQKETGTIIDSATSEKFAHYICELYEDADKADGIYEPDFYEVCNEETWIYDVNKKKYYKCVMMIPAHFDNNHDRLFIFTDVYDPEIRLVFKDNKIKTYYGGIEFLEYWRENHDC